VDAELQAVLINAVPLLLLAALYLVAAAGLLPRSLRRLGPADPTILLLAQRLTDPRLSVAARAALRSTVEAIARCWANPAASASLGTTGQE